jgi:hypothetical protein
MSFPYAHHRPLTPITPVHSPHPSGSSIRSRTPGQLSLHDYRKQQVTPSPQAIPGQKSIKRKSAASSLRNSERIPPEPPNAELILPHYSTSTPPLTPSLDPPTPFHFPPTHFHYASLATPPELARVTSSDLEFSPPNSPSLEDPTSFDRLLPNTESLPSTPPHLLSNFLSFARQQAPNASQHSQHLHDEYLDVRSDPSRFVQYPHCQLQVFESLSEPRERSGTNTTPTGSALSDSRPRGPKLSHLALRATEQSKSVPPKPTALRLETRLATGARTSFVDDTGQPSGARPSSVDPVRAWRSERHDGKFIQVSNSHER